jgi:hypothetical protein
MYLVDFKNEFLTNLPESIYTSNYIHVTNGNFLRYTNLVSKYNQQLSNHTIDLETKKHYYKYSNLDINVIKTQIKFLIAEQQILFNNFKGLLII